MFSNCKYDVKMFRIAKEINVTDAITKIIAFQPPKKCQYTLQPVKGVCFKAKRKHCCPYEKVNFLHDKYGNISYKWIEEECYTFKIRNEKSKNKDKSIVILHLKNINKPAGGNTIIFSHGNSSTLGTIYSMLIDICTQLKCDIIAYDYSGYGQSEGTYTEQEIYINIEEIAFFTTEILGIPCGEMILLGYSIGSAPSIHLAIQASFKDVKGVILISPIASGVKLVTPDISVKDLENIDVFCNIKKIIDVSCPIFIIHGDKDEVIPVAQSLEMIKYMKIPYEWHPRHGDHSNILTRYRAKFIQKCKFFFDFINHFHSRDKNSGPACLEASTKLNSEKIRKYPDYFRSHNMELLLQSKIEESYIYLEKTSKGKIRSSEQKYGLKDKQHPTNKFNSLVASTSKFEKMQNSLYDNNTLEHQTIEHPNFLSLNNYSEENVEVGVSKGSNLFSYIHNKDLEDQYNKIMFKHNGR